MQSMYAEIYLDMVDGQPAETSFDLERQFRYELPVGHSSIPC
jgi:hypothetical protein